MYPTARMIFVSVAGIPLTLLAIAVAPSLWPVGIGWAMFSTGIFLLDAIFAAKPSSSSISLLAPRVIGVGRAEPAAAEVKFAGRAPHYVEFAVDTDERVRAEPHRIASAVSAGIGQADFALHPVRRGQAIIEAVSVRWRGPFGLIWRQVRSEPRRIAAIVPNVAQLKEDALRLLQRETGQIGLRTQGRPGEGSEFNALTDFRSGMDRRMIDWKQTARHGKLLVRELQAEENLHIVFAVDTGRVMCEPLAGLPRIDRAIQALLLLAFVALRLGDRVGVFAFDERPVLASGTVSGVKAFPMLQRVAAQLDYSDRETNFTLGLSQLSAETARRSIVVIFTDFSDPVGAELMVENVKQLLARHLVLFVAFQDEELETMRGAEPKEPADVSRAVLADGMLREREKVIMQLKRVGVRVVDAPVEAIGLSLVHAYVAVKNGALGV